MRTSLVRSACAILLALATSVQAQQATTEVSIRYRQFTIPFELPENTTSPVSVQLHVSSDEGTTWQLVDAIDQVRGKFQFRTEKDGSYWFCSLTVFADGRKLPATFRPEIKVNVDTTPPTIQLTPQVSPGGWISIECRANDQELSPNGLRLESSAGDNQAYLPIRLNGPVQLVAPGSLLCRASWQPTTNSRLLLIRAIAVDKAGNSKTLHKRLFLPPVSLRRPPADNGRRSVPWPADNEPVAPLPHTKLPGISRPGTALPPPKESPPAPKSPVVTPLPRIDTAAPAQGTPAVPGVNPIPTVDRSRPDPIPDPEPVTGDRRESMIHVTSSRQFHLQYELQENLAVREVQLWGTVDGGRSWQKWGIDADRTSPLQIATEQDGLYGFRIVIEEEEGGRANAPAAGADADVWIRVDSTQDGP
jgi:hypothetical protein